MSNNSQEYKTPEEKVKVLLDNITTTLSQGKSDKDSQKLVEPERKYQEDFNPSKTKIH
jgi:hypothetical protein